MKFGTVPEVNIDNYKTDKIILTRIPSISGERFDTYVMGSRSSDYDRVTDAYKLKYRDNDAIVSGS